MSEIKYSFKNKEEFDKALSGTPIGKFVKERSIGGSKKSRYVPIEVQQAVADRMFLRCVVMDEKYIQMMNEIVCTVKLEILPSYPESETLFITGSASKAIQQKSQTSVDTFAKNKIVNSLEYCLPAARSAAMGNALATFGNIFGRNLNRDKDDGFSLKPKNKE